MKELVISHDKPEALYQRLKDTFGEAVDWDSGVIIANGFTLHCKFELPPQKVIHELVHSKRQEAMGKELWWDLYLTQPAFRLQEEVLAYRSEYKFLCDNISDRNMRFECLYELAQNLSSKQYGSLVTGDEAVRLIQK